MFMILAVSMVVKVKEGQCNSQFVNVLAPTWHA
jgi:hypothetical protein